MEGCLGLIFLVFVCCLLLFALDFASKHVNDILVWLIVWPLATGISYGMVGPVNKWWKENPQSRPILVFVGGVFALSVLWLLFVGVDNWWNTTLNTVFTGTALVVGGLATIASAVFLLKYWITNRELP